MKVRALLIAVSVAISLAVAFAYGGFESFERIAALPLWPLGIGLLMIIAAWQVNTLRLRILLSGVGMRLKQREAFPIVMATEFSYAATPANAGGPITCIYLLTRRGLSGAQATAVYTLDQLFDLVFFITLLPLLAVLLLTGYEPERLHHQLALITAIVAVGVGLIVLIVWKYRRVLLFVGRILHVFRISSARRIQLGRAFVRFRQGVRLILALPRSQLFAVYTLCALHWLLRYNVLFILLIGAGAEIPWSTVILLQMLVLTAGQISLLPGGSGAVELTFGVLMTSWLDPATTAAVLIEWRFIVYFWYLIAGAPFFTAQIVRGRDNTAIDDSNGIRDRDR